MTTQFKDLFISYGRRESLGFVGRLHQQLKLAGYDVWFDKVNIPDGEDYTQRINHGIESAHNFAYVMAPWCMSSPYCLIELEYARLLGKRVIPINHKAPSKTEERPLSASIQQILVDFYKFYHLPPQNIQTNKDVIKRSRILVGKSNWLAGQEKISDEDCKNLVEWAKVYENNWTKHDDLAHLKTVKLPLFGETVDAIEGVIERITAVLDRQIDYVHQHTEVLAEALHWQKNQKASVHLLVGKERISAEDWLLTDFLPPKQPPSQPSTLVCEFICESRKNVENLMTDIFICYDRYDQTIRDNVIQSLSRHAKTTWAHDRDIQKGADYQREIEVGIENADNFFYFISPHAVVSEYCQAELKHAIQYNKRIIPLLIIPTEEAAVPESLRGLQYIDFTDNTCQADYDSDIDDILNILRQDQEYYKQHKILLARALKWAAENQKPSFLLSGHNLENAKTWWRLHEKREQHPPLPVHQELIAASEAAKGQLSTEVFISYSRKDSDFARQLNMSLQEAGKTTWFDQESISSGVDFENEIFKGISGADNFLFVLSPDAVESEYCENEVNYAVSQNKRFISVLHREVDSGTLPEKLQKLHWIDFKDKAFEQSFPELVQTIELDREHAHQHTLLQQRATDWSENRQCSDFLLNTAACYDAEQWLRTTENKQPEPTALQRDFIQQSRKAIVFAESAVAKRRKITFTTITTGMIFAVFLAVFAVIQMNTANENLQFAKARLYHAKAQVLKATDAPIALRLAEKSRELDPLNESIDRTLQDIYAHGELDLSALPYGNGTVLPNGKRNNLLLATGKVGTEPIAIDVEGQQVVKDIASEWDISEPLLFSLNGHKKWVSHAAFSPDGSKIVTASGDATAKIWDRKGNLLTTLVGHQKVKISEIEGQEDRNLAVYYASFSPDSTKIVTASADKTAKVWDVQGNLLTTLTGHKSHVMTAIFSPDRTKIVTTAWDKTARVWDINGKLLLTLKRHEDGSFYSAVFSLDSTKIITLDRIIKVWDMQGQLLATLEFSPYEVSIPKNIKEIGGIKNILISLSKYQGSWGNNIAFSPDGNLFVNTDTIFNNIEMRDIKGKLLTIFKHYNPTDTSMIISSYGGSGRADGNATAMFSSDSSLIVTTYYSKIAKIWDINGELQANLRHQDDPHLAVFSPDSTSIITMENGTTKATVWNDWKTQKQFPISSNIIFVAANLAVLSPNKQQIVTTNDNNIAKLWDISGKLLATLQHEEEVKSVLFSKDGSQIKTITENTVNIWRNDILVDDFLRSKHLAKLTIEDQILAEVLTLEEISKIEEMSSDDLIEIANFYIDKASQSYIPELKKKYLQQAAMLLQKINPSLSQGQSIKQKLVNLARSDFANNKQQSKSSESQTITIISLINIPLIIFMGFLMLVVSIQQKVFFQNRQYLQSVIYGVITAIVLIGWFSVHDGIYYILRSKEMEYFWLFIELLIAAFMTGIGFIYVRRYFQKQPLRILFQILCLTLFILLVGYLKYLSQLQTIDLGMLDIFLEIVLISLLPIPITYYALQTSDKWWKWLLRKGAMLLVFLSLLATTYLLIALLDNALAFYNPIPTNLRFLLLLAVGIILGTAIWYQFKTYLYPQKKWFTMLSFISIYSLILCLSLIAFWDYGTFILPFFDIGWQRVILFYEISDTLTLLLAFAAASFATFWAIKGYQTQNYIKSGIYALAALFLVSSSLFYFRAYMSMMPFFTVVIGGMLLFVHSVSIGFDNKFRFKFTLENINATNL